MSNKIIVLWGFVIVILVCAVYVIGINYKGEIEYVNLKNDVKTATKKYIDDNNITLPVAIKTEDLEELGYIKEMKIDKKICAADVYVTKKFLFNNYDIKFTCVNTEV